MSHHPTHFRHVLGNFTMTFVWALVAIALFSGYFFDALIFVLKTFFAICKAIGG